ncbi:MAG: hypothetical protein JMN27_04400 [gamma proteobacterium endosymbiont of Lamellibrachia anaximandri]|nr:hypothetical protein [gamma proteobacterium endosymbiont of Lamellibrachia anaximandri]MBL3533054.1 hypothetical protein [gamma proteobacterium endosymbiont of Lamellibrachia anaximandri]
MTDMKIFPILFTTLILSGCGGGETQTADGGIGGTGVAWGRVTGFGSIYLNDIKYTTTNTSYQFEEPTRVDQSDLKVGMVVRITGSNDGVNGEAETVEYADLLEGTVSGNDIAGSSSLTVMGQTVIVDLDTIYDDDGTGILLADLAIDAVIEVSGFSDGLGVIYATRIEVKSAAWNGTDQLEVKGIVQNLTATTFELGALTVDFAVIPALLPDGTPQEGTYVEAKGNSFNGAIFEADEVETEGDGDLEWAEDGEELEIEGIVTTDFDGVTNQFTLNGQTVQITASTEFEDGLDTDITIGTPLEVEGTMDGTVLIASEIEFGTDSADKLEIEDIVASVDLVASSFMVQGGQTFVTTTSTIFIDELTNDQFFSLASLNLGDSVDVNYVDEGGTLTATKVERE